MKKSDLKNGMYIQFENGELRQVLLNTTQGDILVNGRVYNLLMFFNEDLVSVWNAIVQVRQPKTEQQYTFDQWDNMEVVWDKDEISLEEEFRKMWRWLADHPEKGKKAYFKDYKGHIPASTCFACEATLNGTGHVNCSKCPLPIKHDMGGFGCANGLYQQWNDARRFHRALLAHEISELEWEEVEGE